jgi:hypothetical protein
MRGLDVAFYQPRSRYHTTEDDVRHCEFTETSVSENIANSLQQAKGRYGICSGDLWQLSAHWVTTQARHLTLRMEDPELAMTQCGLIVCNAFRHLPLILTMTSLWQCLFYTSLTYHIRLHNYPHCRSFCDYHLSNVGS